MLKYTICFIQKGREILLLNRVKEPSMGMWNGVGGKIEKNETAVEGIIREVLEETGIVLSEVQYAGNVIFKDIEGEDGMYVYLAQIPANADIQTPQSTDEGILDWKEIDWILDSSNQGVVGNLKYYLPIILDGKHNLEHTFMYNKHSIINYSARPLLSSLNI